MSTDIVLNGDGYVRLPDSDTLYPEGGISIDLNLNLPNWSVENSSQIVGNFSNQGYGVFYRNGYGEINSINLLDSGNNHLFRFNESSNLVSQRNFPSQDNPTNITASIVDHNGNMIYWDQGNSNIYMFDGNSILEREISIDGVVITNIHIDDNRQMYLLNTNGSEVLKYTYEGIFVESIPLGLDKHTNFALDLDDNVVSFFSNPNTPMLFDCNGNYYNLFGLNLYRNGVPFFYVDPEVNTFGIDDSDDIWIVYKTNRMVKINTSGVIIFDKQFHEIQPCNNEGDLCNTNTFNTIDVGLGFTVELTPLGLITYTWVLLSNSNYILKLDTDGVIDDCILITNYLDVERYSDTNFSDTQLFTHGDFTGFYARKYYDIGCSNSLNSQIIARVAIKGFCDEDVVIRTLSSDVSRLSEGEHNINFSFDGISGVGTLRIDGIEVDRFQQNGTIYYDTNNRRPVLIGADVGNSRAQKEELGIANPIYFVGIISQLLIFKRDEGNLNISNQRSRTPITMEFPTTSPVFFEERVDKFYLFRDQGFKSSQFNLEVKNTGITSESTQDIITKDIMDVVDNNSPTQSNTNNIEWVEEVRFRDLI